MPPFSEKELNGGVFPVYADVENISWYADSSGPEFTRKRIV
jgi:hypothetical protein